VKSYKVRNFEIVVAGVRAVSYLLADALTIIASFY